MSWTPHNNTSKYKGIFHFKFGISPSSSLCHCGLKGAGHDIVSAVNGAEALEKLRAEGFDMIVSDILMPVMDGYEVTRELRGLPEFKETPIIALTAYAMKGDQEKILEAGCNGYIPKPIVPEEFIQVVDSYLK